MPLSIGAYYVFTLFAGRSEDLEPNSTLFLMLIGIALSTVLLSFLIKSRLLNRAIEQQQIPMVQQAYVVSWAIAEVPALLGLLVFFLTSNRYFFVLFIIGACGQLLHFPRREDVINAAVKKSGF